MVVAHLRRSRAACDAPFWIFLSPRPLSPMHSNKGNEIPFLRATRLSAIYSGEHRCKCGMKTCSEDVISVAGGTMKS
ncbi:hypothetical protein ALC56_12328 [Trachymyrmex septentrionalis]|uniref:Uncharacterized protein n=1 Tax=Trachymyrmex septentrionalis TaxID=34720 RepID=A0A195EZS4_9HYME|nr:hypothetical protein ALC56_12328 [Trachymyrmex septentrionalis]